MTVAVNHDAILAVLDRAVEYPGRNTLNLDPCDGSDRRITEDGEPVQVDGDRPDDGQG